MLAMPRLGNPSRRGPQLHTLAIMAQGRGSGYPAVMVGPAGWVVNCDHGPVVVNEGDNYAGHSKGKDREPDNFGHWMNRFKI